MPPDVPKHITVDKSKMDPTVVVRRAAAREAARKLAEERENALGGVKPFTTRVIDLPTSEAKRIDDAFPHEIRFNLAEPEPAIRAGAHGVPQSLSVDLAGSTVGDIALIAVESRIPTHEEIDNGDGTVTRRPLNADQRYAKLVESVFSRAFLVESQSLADLLPQRVRVAWRLTRELGRLKGLVHPDEPLSSALIGDAKNADPWQIPEAWHEPAAKEARMDLWPEVIDAFRASEGLDDDFQVHLWVAIDQYKPESGAEWRKYAGFGLIPPPVPPVWRDQTGEIARNYVPKDDPNLNLFLSVVSDLAERLQVPQGSRLDPDQGRLGLQGLLDPALIRLCWPTRTQIMTWEAMLIEETLDLVVKSSVSEAKKVLKDKYGLSQREIFGLLRMASSLAQEQTAGDREEGRAIMVLRLEEYIRRSKDALDLKAEMHGLKQLSIVLGLSDPQHNDPMLEFLSAVREVGAERKARGDLPMSRRVPNEAPQLVEQAS